MPAVNLGADTSLCVNTSLVLDAFQTGATYNWQDNTTRSSITVTAPGTYWVQLDLDGCTRSDTVKIYGITKPQFTLGPDQFLCPGQSLTLAPGVNNVTYQWQDGSTGNQFVVRNPGSYTVDITNRCGTTSDTINITEGNCTIFIPSAFTPNGDGLNDRFEVSGTGLVSQFELRIYDRGGQVLFETKDKNASWIGEYKGKKLSTGVYVYMLIYEEINNPERKLKKGTVLLIR